MTHLLLVAPLGMLAAISAPAHAGYGDVIDGGYPSAEERALHLWTNAARVAPSEFTAFYSCSMDSWQDYEKQPQMPIPMDYNLVEAARFHSQDMSDNNHFSHDSSDGTTFQARMTRFYDNGFVGENIAQGYPNEFDAVFSGWMCSSGHRANIMLPDWKELGTGVVGNYYTQDFGGGAPDSDAPVVMGAHWPPDGPDTLSGPELLADWLDAEAPTRLVAVVDGRSEPMELLHGAPEMGIYNVEIEHDNAGCHEYWFWWETAAGDQGSFPESGSYLYGEGCAEAFDETANQLKWVDGQVGGPAGENGAGGGISGEDIDVDDIRLVGCTAAPAAPMTGGLLLVAFAGLLRRRETG